MNGVKVMNSYCICWLIIIFVVIVHTKANQYNISNTGLKGIQLHMPITIV